VVFYESAAPAPREPVLDQRLHKVLSFIERHADQRITLEALASQAGLSSDRLRHLFKEVFQISLRDHCTQVRIEKAKNLLADFNLTILDIAGRVGYSAQRNFARDFKKLTQQTPSQFRKDVSKLFSNPPAATGKAR
jgi:two-component system response regulator YesN